MKLNEIQNLIRFVAKSGVSEIELELDDFKIKIKNPSWEKETIITEMSVPASYVQAQPIQATPIASSNPTEAIPIQNESVTPSPATDESKYHIVKAPMIGTFYRTSGPGKPAFVNVGDEIKKGQPLCVIEAMKLFNEIESEVSGKIVKILVEDMSPLEYETPMFLIDPS
ncbi:MAG: acetyl-CoA carboxylase biotin carboxyl carrier protein [Bacteroidota bacterium]|nr:acetyl-CoA carboxylase biotin carboxyl carrier protein [Bacteroidota bacterium]